jgi:hypothetical protein
MLVSVEKPLGRFTQQPWEKKRYKVNYTQALGETELLVTPSFVIDNVTVTPFVIDTAAVDSTGKYLLFYASGGEDGQRYKVSVRMITSAGQKFEDEVEFFIEER